MLKAWQMLFSSMDLSEVHELTELYTLMKGDNNEEMPAIISAGGQCHQQNKTEAGHGGRLGVGCRFMESSQGRSLRDGDPGMESGMDRGQYTILGRGTSIPDQA